MDGSPPPRVPRDFRVWRERTLTRTRNAADRGWIMLKQAPWRRIGIWAGGIFGVLAATLILFLSFADWNAYRGPIARFASAATGRDIVIRGNLDVDPWSWTPRIHVEGLHIGNTQRYRDRPALAEVRQADAHIKLLPLLMGRFDIVQLNLRGADVNLYRNPDGVSNWASESSRNKPLNMPAIRQFALRDGRVRFQDDKRHLTLDAAFTTEESTDRRSPGRFALDGEGRINDRPFALTLTGAPLLNVRRDRPYAFNADVHAGATHIVAQGAIDRPFDFGAWSANVEGSGPDLADLYALIGLALPNTPPYSLRGRVVRALRVPASLARLIPSGFSIRLSDSPEEYFQLLMSL